jgi:hypothetical protein
LDIEKILVPDFVDRAQNAEQAVSVGGQGLQRHRQSCSANQNSKVNGQEIIDPVSWQTYN